MPQNRPYLIIAQSGRALATSAGRAGIAVHVIDRFADVDTAALALSCNAVAGGADRIEGDHLLHLLDGFHGWPLAGIVTGGGLEGCPEILEKIPRYGRLCGNSARTVRECKDPLRFFTLLDRIGIPHPAIRMQPARAGDWLLKRCGGAGGGHIRPYLAGEALPPEHYLQERLEGCPLSVVFIANGIRARIAGFNETWTCASAAGDYRYAGAVSIAGDALDCRAELEAVIYRLAEALTLQGLCGLDLVVTGNDFRILEINPRPTATFELHERDTSLFWAHLRACEGELVDLPGDDDSRGQQVCYSGADFTVAPVNWPIWVTDRPTPGRKIAAGEPVCTVQAQAGSTREVKSLLAKREREVAALLGGHRRAA